MWEEFASHLQKGNNSEYSKNSSPVKVKKFKVDTNSNTEDLIMENVSIEHFPDIDFTRIEIPTTITLSTIKSVCIGQLVTIKAKVIHLTSVQYVQSGKLRIVEADLLNPSATLKVILWEDFVDAVADGNTYMFHNMRMKKDSYTSEIYVNTAKYGTPLQQLTHLQKYLPLPHASLTTTIAGEILGI